jgi:hypothetical protein
MNNRIKKKIKRWKKLEFIKFNKINNFEKNPKNGGTPAIENNIIEVEIKNNEFVLMCLREKIVFVEVEWYWKRTRKKINRDILYINI